MPTKTKKIPLNQIHIDWDQLGKCYASQYESDYGHFFKIMRNK